MDARWQAETAAILSGFKAWRQAHPRATLAEIEAALDSRWAVARARLVEDAALASAAADLRALPPEARPRCPVSWPPSPSATYSGSLELCVPGSRPGWRRGARTGAT